MSQLLEIDPAILEKAQKLFKKLTDQNELTVTCNFYGSGDEGRVEDGYAVDTANKDIPLERPLASEFIDLAEEILHQHFGNWEDGVGAEGTIKFVRNADETEIRVHYGEPDIVYTDYATNTAAGA